MLSRPVLEPDSKRLKATDIQYLKRASNISLSFAYIISCTYKYHNMKSLIALFAVSGPKNYVVMYKNGLWSNT